jgi:hypothetical protein
MLRRLAGIEQQIVDCTLDTPGVDLRGSDGASFDIDRDAVYSSMTPHSSNCSLGGHANVVMSEWIVSVTASESQQGVDEFSHRHHGLSHLIE